MKKISLIAIWLACCALGCIKSSESPQVGTNTNWLKACNEDAQCGSEGACLCGVCTMACSSDTQCGTVSSATRCEPLTENACGVGAQVASAACMQGCTSDSECTAIEQGVCVDGLCVPGQGIGATARTDLFALKRSGELVLVPSAYSEECSAHADCTLVETSCSGCCREDAIQADLSELYEQNLKDACADYRGGICDCQPADVFARCVAGRCRQVPRMSIACFSPTQNLDKVNDPEFVGCACPQFKAAICVDQVALYCSWRRGRWSWEAGLDTVCQLGAQGTCPPSQVRPTADTCLAEYNTCYQLPSGEFCQSPDTTAPDAGVP
jgi:hypothetical protein